MREKTGIATKDIRVQRERSRGKAASPVPARSRQNPEERFLILQRSVGNQAVQWLFKSGLLQAELTINKPNDIYEQEADRVADPVMRRPEKGADNNEIDSTSRISQSEIGNPQSEIQLRPG
jgi:hypothetical protein